MSHFSSRYLSGLLYAGLALTACGSAPNANTGAQTLMSDTGRYRLVVTSDPSPPIRGVNAVTYFVEDGAGTSLDGLGLQVVPWMPAHGHGTSVTPEIQPEGGGKYIVGNVLFFMPGTWELRTTFTTSGDHAAPSFEIP
jgi:hypothetical protein